MGPHYTTYFKTVWLNRVGWAGCKLSQQNWDMEESEGQCLHNGTYAREAANLCQESIKLEKTDSSGTGRSRRQLGGLVDVEVLEGLERGDNAQELEETGGDLETL